MTDHNNKVQDYSMFTNYFQHNTFTNVLTEAFVFSSMSFEIYFFDMTLVYIKVVTEDISYWNVTCLTSFNVYVFPKTANGDDNIDSGDAG